MRPSHLKYASKEREKNRNPGPLTLSFPPSNPHPNQTTSFPYRRIQRKLPNTKQHDGNNRHHGIRNRNLSNTSARQNNQVPSPPFCSLSLRTFESSSHSPVRPKCGVALQTCRNKPTVIQIVALVRNMTGICHVTTCSKLGWTLCSGTAGSASRAASSSVLRWRSVLESRLRRFCRPSRCEDRRCRRTVWSAAVRMLKSESTMPQYQVVRMGQGETSPEGRIEGHEPVDVRTPARRADCGGERGVR